jgi:isopenicillin N synthase-like dioxygenase
LPELKEGFNIGDEIPTSHPYFTEKKLNSGPNLWPETMPGLDNFKTTTMRYYRAMRNLAKDVLAVLAATLDLPETYFDNFATDPVATMRLMHYPPQTADADEKLVRGIGAHTDFGAVTLLMQRDVGGLQVWEKQTEQWLDVRESSSDCDFYC